MIAVVFAKSSADRCKPFRSALSEGRLEQRNVLPVVAVPGDDANLRAILDPGLNFHKRNVIGLFRAAAALLVDVQIAKDKAEFEMTLAAWEAEQKANLAIRQQAAVDKAGEGKRQEAEGRLQQVFGGAVNEFTSQVADFLARMEQTAATSKQRRRVLRTYRDENDNLVGEEHFVDDDAGAPPA